ncbi:MAG: hypothetical protein WDZ41_00710 [Candidatus Babeliales bacterium]
MKKFCIYFYLFNILFVQTIFPLKIDRVILSTNDNPLYIQFWPLAARAWQEIVGVRPTLALIGNNEIPIDEQYGDVIRFTPIEGVPTSLYAQCVRLLLPCLFPADGCILADIDLIPLQKKFFIDKVTKISDDRFVIYKSRAYWFYKPRIYMCYNAAKGSTFQDIFGVTSYEEIPEMIKQWAQLNIGWATDEIMGLS